jgi:3-deoxy-D-manno-octulosonic-acid transferase
VLYLLYNVALTAGLILSLPFLPLLLCLGERFRLGFLQRLGFYPKQITEHGFLRPVWIHAASVGEVRSVIPLIRELKTRFPKQRIILSTFTLTGNRMARAVSGADRVLFLPLDFFWAVRRALRTFAPALIVIVETEVWPNFLREAYLKGIPTILLSGRLSARSLPGYLRFRFFFAKVLGFFSAIGMQTEQDAARIRALGAVESKVSVVGSLKFAVEAPTANQEALRARLHGDRPWFVAGSTHRGEEEILLQAFALLRSQFPTLSMVLAPRHPERFGEVERLLQYSGFEFAKRSQISGDRPFDKDILLLDSVGELSDFFALGDVAFVGGSLVDAGGHNVLEPARWHKPILFGPFMTNFKAIAEQLKGAGAAIEVRSSADLSKALAALLGDAERNSLMGDQAARIADEGNHVLSRNFRLAERYLC